MPWRPEQKVDAASAFAITLIPPCGHYNHFNYRRVPLLYKIMFLIIVYSLLYI